MSPGIALLCVATILIQCNTNEIEGDDCDPTCICNDNEPCVVNCIGEEECFNSNIDAAGATSLHVVCRDFQSCKQTDIYCRNAINCSIDCYQPGSRNCMQMGLDCGYSDCTVNCGTIGTYCQEVHTPKVTNASSFKCIGNGCTPTMINAEFTRSPTHNPTYTFIPTITPTYSPTINPSNNPTINPTFIPTSNPTITPTYYPTMIPTYNPTHFPTDNPTYNPTKLPIIYIDPTMYPTFDPTILPTFDPTIYTTHKTSQATYNPTFEPTILPTYNPNDYITSETLSTKISIYNVDELEHRNETIQIHLALVVGIGALVCIIMGIVVMIIFCVKSKRKTDKIKSKGIAELVKAPIHVPNNSLIQQDDINHIHILSEDDIESDNDDIGSNHNAHENDDIVYLEHNRPIKTSDNIQPDEFIVNGDDEDMDTNRRHDDTIGEEDVNGDLNMTAEGEFN